MCGRHSSSRVDCFDLKTFATRVSCNPQAGLPLLYEVHTLAQEGEGALCVPGLCLRITVLSTR